MFLGFVQITRLKCDQIKDFGLIIHDGKGSNGSPSERKYHAEWKWMYQTATTHTLHPKQCSEAADIVPMWQRKHSSSNGKNKVEPIWRH